MKRIFGALAVVLVLTGCSSVSDIARVTTVAATDDGAKPIAAVTVKNISYSLFGCIPLRSGRTWKGECAFADRPSWNAEWFCDNVSPEDNLLALKALLKEVGSNKVANLVERSESWCAWSLWIIHQRMETSSCTVLE